MNVVRFAILWCACLASTAALATAAQAQGAPELLSHRPTETAQTTEFDSGTSTIEPRIDLSYGMLAAAANAAADRFAGPRSGATRIGCSPSQVGLPAARIGMPQGCADVDWHITAARNGTITAKRDGQGVALAIPVRMAPSAATWHGLRRSATGILRAHSW